MLNKTIGFVTLLLCLCGSLVLQAAGEKQLKSAADGKAKLVLAERGQTKYVIQRAADASPVEVRAVNDLAEYLKKISGATFPVVTEDKAADAPRIIVGKSLSQSLLGKEKVNSLGLDDFIIRTCGDNVVLAGGGPRGTAFAVYSLLERDLGCIWFNPFGDEYVPQRNVLTLPEINRRETPAFHYRELNATFWRMVPYEKEGAFLLRNKIAQSGEIEWGGVDRVYAHPKMHSIFFYIVPPAAINPAKNHYHEPKDVESIFNDHPEWFSLVGGKRVSSRQLCFSNPELRKTFTSNFLSNIEKHAGKGVFNVSRRDVGEEYCECEACRAWVKREGGVVSAPMLDFVDELAKTVKAKYPEAVVSIWAYTETECPSVLTFPDNVVLDFMPLEKKNFAASLEHPSNAKVLDDLRMWKTKVRKFDTWYYPNPYAVSLAPIGNLHNLADDFRMYKQLNMDGFYYIEQDVGVMETHHLTDLQSWLIAKLEWDADQDVDKLIMTFTEPYYGAAAPMIREYINRLEKATRDMKTPISWSPTLPEFTYLTPVFLRDAQTLFDRAEAAVTNDPTRLLRVRQARMSLDRVSLLLWDKSATDAGWMKQQKTETAKRYETTFNTTAQQRLQKPEFRDEMLKSFAMFLRTYGTDVPLPAEFAGKDAKQLIPDAIMKSNNSAIVNDPKAAIGKALMYKTQGESPLAFGYYDMTNKKSFCGGKIAKSQIDTAGYKFYKMGRAKLSPQGYAWSANWKMQVRLDSQFDAVQPDREYDFYISLRFEGPAYLAGQEGKTDAIFLDRFVFVPVEGK